MGASPNTNAAGKAYLDQVAGEKNYLQGGLLSEDASTGIGYASGSGGTVTQLVSDGTNVELNKICGQVITYPLTLAAGEDTNFFVNNSTVEVGDVVAVSVQHYTGASDSIPVASVVESTTGSFKLNVRNVGAVTLNALTKINFAVIKAVSA